MSEPLNNENNRTGIEDDQLEQVAGGVDVLNQGLEEQEIEISAEYIKCPVCGVMISLAGSSGMNGLRSKLNAHKIISNCSVDVDSVLENIPTSTF